MVTPAYPVAGTTEPTPSSIGGAAHGAGVDAAHIHQDIITGTVMQRPGLNGLLVTVLDRLGRDALGLLELINRLATIGVDLKVLDMPLDAHDVVGGG